MDGPNHHHNVPRMGGMMAHPPSPMSGRMHRKMMMMHRTFFWGENAGTNTRMYALALAFDFAMCFVVEGLSHCRMLKPGPNNNVAAGLAQTLMHAMRMVVAYMAMLAVMSFNGGVFLAAVAGQTAGFLVFGSRVFRKAETRCFREEGRLPSNELLADG